MARARRKRGSNVDLVEAAEGQLHNILALYKLFEDKRPVMVFDLQSQQILAYPYEEYKATLSERSQAMLTAQYDELALAETAGADDLTAAYGVFRDEAQHLDPEDRPATVNTDGWPATQAAWRALFKGVTLILASSMRS